MRSEVIARKSKSAGVPPMWTSVLAVIAHPDGASIGLGPILDAFVIAGAKVEMLCLTHGQAWTLEEAPEISLRCAALSWHLPTTCSARSAPRCRAARTGA